MEEHCLALAAAVVFAPDAVFVARVVFFAPITLVALTAVDLVSVAAITFPLDYNVLSSSAAHRPDPQKRVPNNHLVSTCDPSLLQQSKLRLPSEHRPTAGNDTHSIPRPLWQNIVATRFAQFGSSTEKLDQPLNSPKRVKEHSFPLPQAQSKLSPPPSKLHVQIQSSAHQPKPQHARTTSEHKTATRTTCTA